MQSFPKRLLIMFIILLELRHCLIANPIPVSYTHLDVYKRQVFGFVCIYILTKNVPGNLEVLAFAFSGVPCFLLIIISIGMFLSGKYRHLSPSFRFVHFSLTKKIVGLGGQFFIIMISMLFVFQLINIVISRIAGPIAVTQYNIAYKYFNVLVMAVNIVFTPF